jgi:hypothetical protein
VPTLPKRNSDAYTNYASHPAGSKGNPPKHPSAKKKNRSERNPREHSRGNSFDVAPWAEGNCSSVCGSKLAETVLCSGMPLRGYPGATRYLVVTSRESPLRCTQIRSRTTRRVGPQARSFACARDVKRRRLLRRRRCGTNRHRHQRF